MKYLSRDITLQSYDQIYNTSIKPKLEAIDVFLKEDHMPYYHHEVAHLLDLELDELSDLMKALNITELNKVHFFSLVLNANSEICQLIRRQWRYSNQSTYSPEMVADIYNLNLHKVQCAFEDFEADEIKTTELTQIFKRIHQTIF